MGCGSSKAKDEPVLEVRRRLSLGDVDAGPSGETEVVRQVSEADRTLLVSLNQQQVLDMAKGARRYSIGSETDGDMQRVQSFASKTTKLQGDTFDATKEGIGYCCRKGLKPESPNQDSFFIMKVQGEEQHASIYGVFDGHGRKGHDISNFVKEHLPKVLMSQADLWENPMDALDRTFKKTQQLIEQATNLQQIDAKRSGTTCSVVFHDHKRNTLYVAHVGDSRVVLGKMKDKPDANGKNFESVDLTIDHKPNLPEERERIEKAGGMVVFDGGWNYRVYVKGKRDERGKRYPGLNMSRAMGDMVGFYDAGISAVPDVGKRDLHGTGTTEPPPPETDDAGVQRSTSAVSATSSQATVSSYELKTTDRFLLICSDGIWEFISSEEAIGMVCTFPRDNAMKAAEHLSENAWERWTRELEGQVVDDITALVIYL